MAEILQKNHSQSENSNTSDQQTTQHQITFQQLVKGHSSKKVQRFYIWTVFLSLVAICTIAILLYPTRFTFWNNTISEQGSISQNPIGSIIWRIGVIINGIAHIPHLIYIRHHLKWYNKMKANLIKGIGIVSALGFSFVGLLSIDYGLVHYIAALIAFWGYYFTANISFSVLNRDIKHDQPQTQKHKKIQLFSIYFSIYFNVSGALTLGSFLINKLFFNREVNPILEWNYLIAICLWLLLWPKIIELLEK